MKFSNLTLFLASLVLLITASFFALSNPVRAAHSRVELLTADNFAVLAGSAISDTGTTTIIGNVGLSPTGGASITGLACSEITGTLYDTNGGYTGGGGGSTACRETNAGALTTAKNDLLTAYNDAAGRTTTQTIGTALGGVTLTDGTYDSAAGTFAIATAETLTLNGQGNPDAVFIFKMASTLITGSASQVVLTNGAQACNVYWQVGSSATLGTTTSLVGNILADTSITDNGGSTVNGRLLALDGAVTLNNTTVTKQDCAPDPTPTPPPATITAARSADAAAVANSIGPCIEPEIVTTPLILESTRLSPTSIFINWGPFAGLENFNVRYGLANGDWQYNTNVTGFSTTINDLAPNQPLWIQVAARNNCAIGTYSEPRLVGGPSLPNAGFAPSESILWSLSVGMPIASLLFLKLRRS